MIQRILCVALLVLSGCKANHEHDGLYIANKQITGVTKAWILDGDKLTIYYAGLADVLSIDQYSDRIVLPDDRVYQFNSKGDLVIPAKNAKGQEILMVKFSAKTKYNFGELEKLIDDAIPLQFNR